MAAILPAVSEMIVMITAISLDEAQAQLLHTHCPFGQAVAASAALRAGSVACLAKHEKPQLNRAHGWRLEDCGKPQC